MPTTADMQPTLDGSGDVMPGVSGFSREVGYSDESAAISPDLAGRVSAKLGIPVMPAMAGGLMSPPGSLGPIQELAELLLLIKVKADAEEAGISLQGVDLVPMRLHPNNADYMSVFLAWTNGSSRVYVNVPRLIDIFTRAKKRSSDEKAFAEARAEAVFAVRHEVQHLSQFPKDRLPTFEEMIRFERDTYFDDRTWLSTNGAGREFMLRIGTTVEVVEELRKRAQENLNQFLDLSADNKLDTPAKQRDAMKEAGSLPQAVHDKPNYGIADLYPPDP